MPKQRTSDHIYTLHTLTKTRSADKARENIWLLHRFPKSLWFGMAQWNFPKTYRKWNRRKGVWHHKGHIQGNKCCVKINDKRTDYFSQSKGVRQGCSYLISILTNWHQHLISPLVLAWPSRVEKSNASCTQMIFCCCRLMKRGCTKASPFWKSSVMIGPYR